MDKLDKCYDVGNLIIDKYIKLISSAIYFNDNEQNKKLIDEIKKLIVEEYRLYSTMSLDEISDYLDFISDESIYEEKSVVSRINDKLENFREIINGRYFTSKDLDREKEFGDMRFSIYDVMLSIINVESIKKIKNKIDSLFAISEKDKNFVKELKYRFELSKNELLFSLSTSEMMVLCDNGDIDIIENLNISRLNNLLLKNDDKYMKTAFYNTAAVYMKNILDRIANTYGFKNNPEDVYYYLSLVTRIEVLVNYMDVITLTAIYNYCSKIITDNNKNSIEMVKRLIKQKI